MVNIGGDNIHTSTHGISIPMQPPVTPGQLNPAQTVMLVQALQTIKDSSQKVAADHRDLHSSVSKVCIYELSLPISQCYSVMVPYLGEIF